MIDPSLTRRRRPNPSKKLKLVCSFNGTFQPRPPSGKLRYSGGETRIISVECNIVFSRLKSKISDLVCPKNGLSFSLKYHILDSESIGECTTPLVLITSDDDVRYMIDEYEKLELSGKRTRLWLYVCNDNAFVNSYCLNETEKLCKNNGFGGDRKGNFERKVSDSLSGNCFETRNLISHLCGEEVKNSDDSLRKLVLKQQLLAKKQNQIQNFQSDLDLPVEQTKIDLISESQKDDQPLIDLTSEPECPVTHEPINPNFGSHPYRYNNNMLDYQFPKTHFARSENLCNSHSHLLNPKDKSGIAHPGTNTSTQSLSGQMGLNFGYGAGTVSGISCQFAASSQLSKQPFKSSVNLMPTGSDDKYKSGDLTKENIMPWYANSNSVKTRFAPVSYSNQSVGNAHPLKSSFRGIHNRRYGVNDTRSQRTCPYYFRNHRSSNFTGMCYYRNARLDGRNLVGKFYPGVWSSSNISKQAQAMRLYYPGLWKPWSGYNDQSCDSKENLKDKGGIGVPPHKMPNSECGLGYDSACSARADPSPLPLNAMKDLLTASNGDEHEVPDQATCKNFHGELKNVQPVCLDMIKEPLVDLNLCNLSLSSGKEVDSRDNSSSVSENASEALLKLKSKPSDLMDEEYLSLGLHVKKPNGVKSNSSSRKAAKLEDGEEKEEIQQDPRSTLSFDEKGDIRVSHKCSKADGRVPNDLASFYTHLATRELQTIKASDLEYIKELGSGTYGTVFYGKWKGSDVAIKRLKRSCFTEGSVEEDRLVADFWKEAHILGQLHHPNIVALYGVVTDGPVTNLATLTEYMVNGSLKQVLQKKDRTIDRRKRLIIAMDAAFGMEYLHEKNIVHFDLKSHNFLVNMRDPQRPVCKIGDLGLSKIKQRTLVSGGVRGTIPWMAPELLSSKNNMVTEKVDVYSFGIVMWELLTGEEPYGKLRSEEIIAGIIKGNLRPEIPSWCDPTWRSLMERCWSSDPDSRPAFSEIAKELRAMSASMNIK